ncbi:recombinase zinc beta ribbon domain-containing protein [Candidatus Falkowbacteria bacterium]|nr:recombinase zinc beta ribbon domain-containing protein [Candidatus Falkowbacteria bacterium]
MFRYNNELWQGKHEPMITKKFFDKCQKVLSDRSRPQKRKVKEFAFRGLLFCGECGCAITSETQKGHNYYRCTKKRGKCSQGYIREEVLADQINKQIQKVSLSPSWADKMIEELEKDKEQEAKDGAVFAQNLKSQIKELEDKLDTLLDTHLEGTITKDEYTAKKQKILNHKIEISEKLKGFEQNGNHWLEPAKTNRILRERELFFEPRGAWQILSKSALSASGGLAEPRRGEATNSQHTIWLPGSDSNRRPRD